MINLLKAGCLALYALALFSLWIPLTGADPLLQYAALALLVAHLLEALAFFRLVRRYPGSIATSLLLTLLFGFLHWWPLRQSRN